MISVLTKPLGPAFELALSSDRSVVMNISTDPDVQTLPPPITIEQAKKCTSPVLKGDPNEGGSSKQSAKRIVGGIFHEKQEK